MASRKESAADVTVSVGEDSEVVVERLTLTKNFEISQIRGSGRVFPDSYSIDAADYSGTMELQGNKLDLEDLLFDENGIPVESTINVTHLDDSLTSFTQVLVTSSGWEMSAGETTTTTFEFIAMGRENEGQVDSQP